jgi:hypothetical protein
MELGFQVLLGHFGPVYLSGKAKMSEITIQFSNES